MKKLLIRREDPIMQLRTMLKKRALERMIKEVEAMQKKMRVRRKNLLVMKSLKR
jgi:hypothetical protein